MSSKAIHIIQKQCYDIDVPNEQYGMQLQQGLQQMNLNHIIPALSSKLDELFQDDNVVVIDKLEINIGKMKTHAEPKEWVKKILAGLESSVKLLALKQQENLVEEPVIMSRNEHAINTWLHFITTGSLPAETIFKSVDEINSLILLINSNEQQRLKTALLAHSEHESIIQRMAAIDYKILQFFLQLLMPSITETEWSYLNKRVGALLVEDLKMDEGIFIQSGNSLQHEIFVEILSAILQSANENKRITTIELFDKVEEKFKSIRTKEISAGERGNLATEQINAQNQNEKSKEFTVAETSAESIFINNAGLCLLAPYLGMVFKAIDLCNDNQFISKSTQQHAIYLSHYLATGQTEAPEEQLVFAKLLCGWPLQMPCINARPITDNEMKECNELLVSVIGHWKALKNTSPDGLREAFLQRKGKLMTDDDGNYTVHIEQQTIDILLDSIPWTFRMLKLPWMQKVIKVEWF